MTTSAKKPPPRRTRPHVILTLSVEAATWAREQAAREGAKLSAWVEALIRKEMRLASKRKP